MEMLKDKIVALLAQGKTKEEIYSQLIQEGSPVDLIAAVFRGIEEKGAAATMASTPPSEPVQSAVDQESSMAPAPAAAQVVDTGVDDDNEDEDDHKGRATKALLTVGAILIAAGIFSFIAANWNGMTDFVKVALIIVGIALFNSLGWYLKYHTHLKTTGEALLVLGALTYGAGIFLVAQIFNIRAEWPDGFMIWAIGVLPFAYIMQSGSLYAIGIIVGAIGVAGYPSIGLWDVWDGRYLFNSHSFTDFIMYVTTAVILLFGFLMYKKNKPDDRDYY